jgi:hypothetical protein
MLMLARLGVKIGIASWRHIAIAIGMKCGLDASSTAEGDSDGSADEADMFHAQAAHTRQVAERKYARSLTLGPNVVLSTRQRFKQISLAWHELLGLASMHPLAGGSSSGASSKKHSRSISAAHGPDLAARSRIKRMKQLARLDLQAALEGLCGRDARFRLDQQAILEAICKARTARIIAIMPTGSGKSLLFMLPASIRLGGCSIVVVPLVSLRSDLFKRLVLLLGSYFIISCDSMLLELLFRYFMRFNAAGQLFHYFIQFNAARAAVSLFHLMLLLLLEQLFHYFI